MNVFDQLDQLGVPVPNKPGAAAWSGSLEDAWSGGDLGGYVGQVIGAIDGGELAKLDSLLESIPVDAVPLASGVLKLALAAINAQKARYIAVGRYDMALGSLAIVGNGPFNRKADVPSYTDCSSLKNPRRRTVVVPQKRSAPWYAGEDYPHDGNCGKGYAVWCGSGYGNKKKPGAGGDRCHGFADGSALLFPWWTAAVRPGPMPIMHKFSDDYGPPSLNPNVIVARRQGTYLSNPVANLRLNTDDLVAKRKRIAASVGDVVNVADPEDDYLVTEGIARVGTAAIDAVLQARAAFARSELALAMSVAPGGVKLHSTAIRDIKAAWRDKAPAPGRAAPRRGAPSRPSSVAPVAAAGLGLAALLYLL